MTFQNPVFLWFLAVLLVPIVVHLFDFKRVKIIRFTNVFFLDSLKAQNIPKKRLIERLLLASRLLGLLFLVLLFAGPVLNGNEPNFFSRNKVLVFDNTASLLANCADQSCLDALKEGAVAVWGENEAGFLWLPSSFRPKSFYGSRELYQLLVSVGQTKRQLNLSKSGPRDLVIFSDFQEDLRGNLRALNDSSFMVLVAASKSSNSNVYVDSVSIDRGDGAGLGSRKLMVELHNSGEIKRDNILVRLFGDDRQLGSTALSLDSEESKQVNFVIEESQVLDFRIKVDDSQTTFDNDFFFTLPVVSRLRVGLVSNSINRNIEAVFGNSELFDFVSYGTDNLNFEEIFDFDLLIINELDRIPDWFDFDRMRGDVVVIPSEGIDVVNYPERLGLSLNENTDTTGFMLSKSSLSHPFFQGIFDDLNDRVELPEVRSSYQIRGGDLLLGGKYPFLTFYDDKKLYWFSSPISGNHSSIPNHSIFLPLMYRIAESSRAYNDPLYFELTDQPIELRASLSSESVPILTNETGSYIPDINYLGSGLAFSLPYDLNDPGIYYLVSESDTLSRIALNFPSSESKMDFMNYAELKEFFKDSPNVRVLDGSSLGKLQAGMDELKNGTPLWKYALILALMFLLAETAIHRWMR